MTLRPQTTLALPTALHRLMTAALATATTVTLGLGTVAPAFAQSSAPPARLTPEQQKKIFPERKALVLKRQKAREAILQNSRRCVSAASTQAELWTCVKQERKANREVRSRSRAEIPACSSSSPNLFAA